MDLEKNMNINDIDTKDVVSAGKETVIGTPSSSSGTPNIFLQPIAEVRELLMRMGTPKFGESNLDRLYMYVSLRADKDMIDKKLNTLAGKV